jgi:hypothetical protein
VDFQNKKYHECPPTPTPVQWRHPKNVTPIAHRYPSPARPEIDTTSRHTDKKENGLFLIYKEIQMGSVAKSCMRNGFLIYEEMRKYLTIYEEVVIVTYDFETDPV